MNRQQIIKLSVDLTTSQQEFDHSNLQVQKYRTELSILQDLVEKLKDENMELKYRMLNMEKKRPMERINQTHTTAPVSTSLILKMTTKASASDVTVDTADNSSSQGSVSYNGDVITPHAMSYNGDVITPQDFDDISETTTTSSSSSRITCLDLYTSDACNDTFQEEFEHEANTVEDSNNTPKGMNPVFVFNDKEIKLNKEKYSEDPFATCREDNVMENDLGTEAEQIISSKSAKKNFGWGALQWKRKNIPQTSFQKIKTERPTIAINDNQKSRPFYFGTALKMIGVY